MEASFVDLRKRSSEVINAILRNESVTVLYRGKVRAVMHPVSGGDDRPKRKTREHPAFGLWADRVKFADPEAYVRKLREGRGHAL